MAKPSKPSAAEVAARRRATNIKSAQGTYYLMLITTPIYLVYTGVKCHFRFYFCLFIPEFLFKASRFTSDFDNEFSDAFLSHFAGRIPTVLMWVLVTVILLGFLAAGVAAQRKPKLLVLTLSLTAIDTVALLVGRILSLPEALTPEGWIDVIFHGLLLFLLIVGVVSAFRREPIPAAAGGKKKKKKKKKR